MLYTQVVARIAPFDGLLYDVDVVGDLAAATAPPYDVILADELARFREASRYSITHVDLTEGDPDEEKYTGAGELFRLWRDEGVFVSAGRRVVYPYEMRFAYRGDDRRVRGVIAEVELESWGGSILPHEQTMAGPVEDRLALLRTSNANLSAVYAITGGPNEAQRDLLERTGSRDPDRELTDERGVTHRLWIEPEAGDLAESYRDRTLLIADGHHRYETALMFREEMRSRHGPGPWDRVMMLLVDAAVEDPPVLPIHRVVEVDPLPDLPGHLVRDLGEILAWLEGGDLRFGAVYRRNGDVLHLAGELRGSPPAVRALHHEVLDATPGIRKLRYVPDAVVAEESVRTGEADLALLLPAARATDVRLATERGERLPEKSTYFWPKPRTGMVIRPLDGGEGIPRRSANI